MIIKIFFYMALIFMCYPLNISHADTEYKTTIRGCYDSGGTDGVRYFWIRPEGPKMSFFEVAWEEITKDQWDSLDECYCYSKQECTVNITYTADPEDMDPSAKGLIRKFNSIKK